jgi:hypothetical protein
MKSRSNTPKLFWPARPMHGNVVLNFMGHPASEFSVYASAFWRGGRLLAKSLAGGGYRDMDACPIVFLYRHALELYMKAIVRRGKSLLSVAGEELIIPPRALERHELSPLLEPIKRIFIHVGWISKTNSEGRKMFRDFSALVRNVDRLDAGSYTFRYPVDKKDKALVSHHFGFNVLEFAQQVEGAIRLLDGAVTGLEEEWDQRASEAYAKQEVAKRRQRYAARKH